MRRRAAAKPKAELSGPWSTVHRTTRGTGDTVTGPPTATPALTSDAGGHPPLPRLCAASRAAPRPRRITHTPGGPCGHFVRPANQPPPIVAVSGGFARAGLPWPEPPVGRSRDRVPRHRPGSSTDGARPPKPGARQLLFRRTRPSPWTMVPSSVPLEQQPPVVSVPPRAWRYVNAMDNSTDCSAGDCLVRHVEKAPTALGPVLIQDVALRSACKT